MRRIFATVFISLCVSVVAALTLFIVDFSGPMKNDAAFEAYVRSGNPSLLPPNTLDKKLDLSPNASNQPEAWEFFSLVWLRRRINLLMMFLCCVVIASFLIGPKLKKNTHETTPA